MQSQIRLNDQEQELLIMLLDVANYVSSKGQQRPQLRFTGGWVRDKLLGSESQDIDIGIDNMTGFRFGNFLKDFLELPTSSSWRIKVQRKGTKLDDSVADTPARRPVKIAKIEANPEKSKHLETVTTRLFGFDVDMVNLRKEEYASDSRTPSMEFGSPEEDALRRDSTINSLFYNLQSLSVEDFTGRGLADLKHEVIKTPLAPLQTFEDDPLRVLRAIRFAARLDFTIASEDQEAMQTNVIRTALKSKISRERVGTEIGKMLRGPRPRKALAMIDQYQLYDTIFVDPNSSWSQAGSSSNWAQAYDCLDEILNSKVETEPFPRTFANIRQTLIHNKQEAHVAWFSACFVPCVILEANLKSIGLCVKFVESGLRKGIKADNKIAKSVLDAVQQHLEVDKLVHQMERNSNQKGMTTLDPNDQRADLGMRLRSWGTGWRNMVIFALLVQVARAQSQQDSRTICQRYSAFASSLAELRLLDVTEIKNLVDGNMLCNLFEGHKRGPWLKKALDIGMEWQLRNPDSTDVEACLADVEKRKDNLGLGALVE